MSRSAADAREGPIVAPGPVGLLSDSHGRAELAAKAVDVLAGAGARSIIHLGDIGSPVVVAALARARGARAIEIHLVLGNVEFDPEGILTEAARDGIQVHGPFGRLEVDGQGIAFLHGDRTDALRDALATGPDWLFHGHTHRRRDERVGRVRIVNPGALHRAAEHTVAVVDPAGDRVEFIQVDG